MSLNILPNELIECIAIKLNYIDLCSLLQVNSRLNSYLSNYNGLWQQLFCRHWPALYEEVFEPMENLSEINWRFETIQRHLIGVKVDKELGQMSARYYRNEELSESCFDSFRRMAAGDRLYWVINELEIIVNDDHKKTHNLTIRFYAQKALRSLRTELVRSKWTKMVQELNYNHNQIMGYQTPVNVLQPDKHDVPGDLISGSVLIAQYCQPNITISETKIRNAIRSIAMRAVESLRENHPENYLITHRHGELLTNFEASRLTESVLVPEDCIRVVHALNVAMFEGSNRLSGNRDDYYLPANSYIDKVLELKLGIPILLCAVYQAAGALLGVKLYPISNPSHFMLAIRDKPHLPKLHEQFTFIDPFNDGKLSDQPVNVFPTTLNLNQVVIARPLSVFLRMVSNLVDIGRREMRTSKGLSLMRNGLELANIIYQEDTQSQLSLAQVYLTLDINYEQILQISNQIEQQMGVRDLFVEEVNIKMAAVKPPVVVRYRKNLPEVRFAVGMVMRHRRFRYTCVIYGWNEKCAETLDWIEQMGVKHLPEGEKQPFYRVLLDDASTRYTAQENLDIETNTNDMNMNGVFHPEIGRYFTGFNGRSYKLNEEMRAEFPDDERVVEEIYLTHSEDTN